MKKFLTVCLCVCLACTVVACGKKTQKEGDENTTKKTATEKTTEDRDLEKVTELEKEGDQITFGEIESGLNFKAKGSKVTFRFEEIGQLDNSLKMVFSLTNTSSGEAKEIKISGKKDAYTFKNLKKGEDYYLEVYPTEVASSDAEFEKIEKKNSSCMLLIEQ